MKKIKIAVLAILLVCFFTVVSEADLATKAITAQNQWSSSIYPLGGYSPGYANISITGTWVATITLQRSFDSEITWYDVTTWTANYQGGLTDMEKGVVYRIGCKTGEYSSGTCNVRLSN